MHNYPEEQMPNNEPDAPYQVPLTYSEATQGGAWNPQPQVNPGLLFEIQVCNQTSTAHTLTSLGATIDTFVPSSGQITVWHICGEGPYDPKTRFTTTGCGGGLGGPGVEMLDVAFTHDIAGATASATPNPDFGGPGLPYAIPPHQSLLLYVQAQGLNNQGTYTVSLRFGVDGATPHMLTPSDGAFIIAPSAIVWTGTTCMNSAAMLAKIPTSGQDTYWVCPPSS